ncbi:cytochrome c3 family protein [Geoalkalibacter halelectricus]|uniref:cytochrome c3 family protein n=1 Tax=Geoalkalibacter halelectricus TaxID=2847045 RepID=UPI003D19E433
MRPSRLILPLLLLLLAFPVLPEAGRIPDIATIEVDATGPVHFSHYRHLEKLGNNCKQCHNHLYNIRSAENPRVTMKEMAAGQSCGACHNSRRAFTVTSNCYRCHPTREVAFAVPDIGDVVFSHQVHLSMFGCGDCHPGLYRAGGDNPRVSMEQMEQGLSCGACHDGAAAFGVAGDCAACHAM